jgi:hypothetical protein
MGHRARQLLSWTVTGFLEKCVLSSRTLLPDGTHMGVLTQESVQI